MMYEKLNIIIVDDHELFREGLKFFLTQIEGMNVIGEAADGEEFLKLLDHVTPDLVFMDIDMPVMNGIRATELAMKKDPSLKIIALTGFADEENYYKMVRAGVKGFILKHSGKEDIETAIYAIMKNECYFSRELLQTIVLKRTHHHSHSGESDFHITAREKEILHLICLGCSDNEIAEKLDITPKAANSHRNRLLLKTGSKNSASLVMFAIKNRIVRV